MCRLRRAERRSKQVVGFVPSRRQPNGPDKPHGGSRNSAAMDRPNYSISLMWRRMSVPKTKRRNSARDLWPGKREADVVALLFPDHRQQNRFECEFPYLQTSKRL